MQGRVPPPLLLRCTAVLVHHCPLCDIPAGCCSFTGPWTVTRSSLRMLRRVAAFCQPLRPVLLAVVSAFAEPSSWCVGTVLNVAWCAVCVSAAPNNWRIEDVLVAGVIDIVIFGHRDDSPTFGGS